MYGLCPWCGEAFQGAWALALLVELCALSRAVASAEGRLQLEQQRHTQQLERLQFENEELRRASRAKSDKIAHLRAQLDACSQVGVAGGS